MKFGFLVSIVVKKFLFIKTKQAFYGFYTHSHIAVRN